MNSGWKYIIKIGKWFIGRYFETQELFLGKINNNGSYKEFIKLKKAGGK